MPNINSTDATRGLPLAERVILRMAELEAALNVMDETETGIERDALALALAAGKELTTGDLEHPTDVVAREMNTWLERNKYLAETPVPARGSDPEIAIEQERAASVDDEIEEEATAPVRNVG